MSTVNTNGEVLKWARLEHDLDEDQAARRIGISVDELRDLEADTSKPTAGMLRKMAAAYEFAVATLAMPAPLPSLTRPKDFRTIEGRPAELSTGTLVAFEEALEAQETIDELSAEDGTLYVAPDLPHAEIDGDIVRLAQRERERLNFSFDIQTRLAHSDALFRDLRQRVEAAGIFTFQKDLLDDCRGFSLYDPSAIPIVVINKNEPTSQAKAFTLMHEYAHLLLRASGGVCDEDPRNRIERFANQFATNFLMPRALVERYMTPIRVQGRRVDRDVVLEVARRLRVSQQSFALRLEELGFAPAGFYKDWIAEQVHVAAAGRARTGGIVTHEVRKVSEYGRRYAGLAVQALDRHIVSKPVAVGMLGTTGRVFARVRTLLFG